MNKQKKNTWLRPLAYAGAALLLVAAALIGWGWWLAGDQYHGEEIRIFLPSKSTLADVGDTLRAHTGKYGDKVERLLRLQDAKHASGSYIIKPGMSTLATSRMIMQGRQTPVNTTFNNVRLMSQAAEKICRNLEITPEEFLAACDSILQAEGFKPEEYPAAFIPDTYQFYWNANAASVVKRLLRDRDNFWNQERQNKAAALGLTPAQVASVAAIVEEETAKKDERPKVARLYLNRLKKGMPLQADPTVKYAVGDFSLRRITADHLRTTSPYNTYLHPGLTPGPIRIADKQTLDDVLNAPQHNYLYMCAKEDFSGYHNFAADYNTHLNNARRYHAELNRRGIR